MKTLATLAALIALVLVWGLLGATALLVLATIMMAVNLLIARNK